MHKSMDGINIQYWGPADTLLSLLGLFSPPNIYLDYFTFLKLELLLIYDFERIAEKLFLLGISFSPFFKKSLLVYH